MTELQKEQVRRLRREGLSYACIANELGIAIGTIKTFCYRKKVEGRKDPAEEMNSRCQFCGLPVVQVPGRKERKFCSNRCRDRWWNAHIGEVKRDAMDEIECGFCGKVFYAYPRRHRKYCCHDCYIKGRFGTEI